MRRFMSSRNCMQLWSHRIKCRLDLRVLHKSTGIHKWLCTTDVDKFLREIFRSLGDDGVRRIADPAGIIAR